MEDIPSAVIDELQRLHPEFTRAQLEEIYVNFRPVMDKLCTVLADLPEDDTLPET